LKRIIFVHKAILQRSHGQHRELMDTKVILTFSQGLPFGLQLVGSEKAV
jgi:hypothetical protein